MCNRPEKGASGLCTLRKNMRPRAPLLAPSEMDGVFRRLLRLMRCNSKSARIRPDHELILRERYGLCTHVATQVLSIDEICSWRPACLSHVELDPRLPRVPTRAADPDISAIFVPSLDWEQRIVGAALRIVDPDSPKRFLTFGDQFLGYEKSRRKQSSTFGDGFASLRIREPDNHKVSGVSNKGMDVVEAPLHVSRPAAWNGVPRWIGLCEGILKSMAAAQSFKVPIIAEWCSGSGQFYRSPAQLRSILLQASTPVSQSDTMTMEMTTATATTALPANTMSLPVAPVVLLADAGCVSNALVALNYIKTMQLLEGWGVSAQIGWWGQTLKLKDGGAGDVDEMLTAKGYLSPEETSREAVVLTDAMRLLSTVEFEQLLSDDVLLKVRRWKRELGFLSMAEAAVWDSIRVPSLTLENVTQDVTRSMM